MARRCRWRGRSTACAVSTRRAREDLGARRPSHRGQVLPAHDPGGQVVDRPSRRRAAPSQRWRPSSPVTGTRSTTPSPPMARPCSRPIANASTRPRAIGLDETSFVKLADEEADRLRHHRRRCRAPPDHRHLADPQIHRRSRLDRRTAPGAGRSGSASVPSTCRPPMPRSTRSSCPRRPRWSIPSTSSRLANRCLDAVRRRVQNEQTGHRGRRDDPLYRARRVLLRGEETPRRGRNRAPVVTARARRSRGRGRHRLSHQRART